MNINLANKIVPRIGLGCMGMSEFYGDTDDKNSLMTLHAAFEIGYRHFDTADMYGFGRNEELLGRFVSQLGSRRDEIVLTSKVGIVRDEKEKYNISVNSSKEYIVQSCNSSLQRLGTDYIDLYYLHRCDPNTPLEETIGALDDLVQQGKIRAIGMCEVSADTLRTAHEMHAITALQSEYSLWTRDIEEAIIPVCEELDISIVAFSPLGRGFLTGRINQEYMKNADPELDFRKRLPRFDAQNIEANTQLIMQLKKIAEAHEIQMSQLALAWILHKSNKLNIIPGTKNVTYLSENFSAKDVRLTKDSVAELDSIFTTDAVHGDRYPKQILARSNQ